MNNNLIISQLVSLWYEVIAGLHHKDRDCHFYITRHWKYSGESTWEIEHNGYLLNDVNEEFKTYDTAEIRLREILIRGINAWITCEDSSVSAVRREEILKEINGT